MSSDRVTLEVTARDADQVGSRRVRRLRKEGLIPGVLYGKGHTRAILVKERELRTALTGPSGLHAIVDVVIEGQKTPHHAVLKEYQQHPIRGTLTHVDFHEVRLDQPIQATVAVQLVGESPGAKEGGVVQQVTRELRVEALPMGIPEHIEADISSLELGGTIRLAEMPAIEGVTYLDDPETVLATCVDLARPRSSSRRPTPRPRRPRPRARRREAAEGEPAPRPRRGRAGRRGVIRAPLPSGRGRPRRSIFSSPVSGTPGASTRATGTTSAGWSSTSSRDGTAARSRGSSAASSPTSGSTMRSSRC